MAGPSSALDLPFHAHLGQLAHAVEGFFAILTKRRLKRGVFKGVVDLQAAINRFVVGLLLHCLERREKFGIDEASWIDRCHP